MPRKNVLEPYKLVDSGSLALGEESSAVVCKYTDNVGIHVSWDVVAASAKEFEDGDVDTDEDTITEASHGYLTGLKGQLSTAGVLPTGLSAATDYFVIKVDANTFKLATTRANALAGTAIDITAAAGGGTHTFTPTAGGTTGEFIVQATNFPITKEVPSATEVWTNLTLDSSILVANADDTALINLNNLPFRAFRLKYAPTKGQGTYQAWVMSKAV